MKLTTKLLPYKSHHPRTMISSGLELKNATATLGGVAVLRNISLSFTSDQKTLLIGRNGSGKSTLLRLLAGLIKPEPGEYRVSSEIRPFLVRHLSGMYEDLSVAENLTLWSSLFGVHREVEEYIDLWGLTKHKNKPIRALSRGLITRTALALVEMIEPSLILLDEPSSNLDDVGTSLLIERILSCHNRCIVIATHDIHQLGSCASNVVLLEDGEVVASTLTHSREDIFGKYREQNR